MLQCNWRVAGEVLQMLYIHVHCSHALQNTENGSDPNSKNTNYNSPHETYIQGREGLMARWWLFRKEAKTKLAERVPSLPLCSSLASRALKIGEAHLIYKTAEMQPCSFIVVKLLTLRVHFKLFNQDIKVLSCIFLTFIFRPTSLMRLKWIRTGSDFLPSSYLPKAPLNPLKVNKTVMMQHPEMWPRIQEPRGNKVLLQLHNFTATPFRGFILPEIM